MLKRMRDKKRRYVPGGRRGDTPVTTACPEEDREGISLLESESEMIKILKKQNIMQYYNSSAYSSTRSSSVR